CHVAQYVSVTGVMFMPHNNTLRVHPVWVGAAAFSHPSSLQVICRSVIAPHSSEGVRFPDGEPWKGRPAGRKREHRGDVAQYPIHAPDFESAALDPVCRGAGVGHTTSAVLGWALETAAVASCVVVDRVS